MSEITRQVVEERLSGLRSKYQQLLNDANAFHGAIQDGEWFLAKLDEGGVEVEAALEAEVESGND